MQFKVVREVLHVKSFEEGVEEEAGIPGLRRLSQGDARRHRDPHRRRRGALRCVRAPDELTLEGDQQVGVSIVKRTLEEPIRQTVIKAGVEGALTDYLTDT